MSSPKPDAAPAPAPEEKPKPAARPRAYPTLWHEDQIPFPWGSATRQRKRPTHAEPPKTSEPEE